MLVYHVFDCAMLCFASLERLETCVALCDQQTPPFKKKQEQKERQRSLNDPFRI